MNDAMLFPNVDHLKTGKSLLTDFGKWPRHIVEKKTHYNVHSLIH